jgi:hypothetical protein
MSTPLRFEARLRPGAFGCFDVYVITEEGEAVVPEAEGIIGSTAKRYASRLNRFLPFHRNDYLKMDPAERYAYFAPGGVK